MALSVPIGSIQGRIIKMTKITPSDTVENRFDCLWVFGGGTLAWQCRDNESANADSLTVLDNTILPVSVIKVMSTGTTATLIYGCRIAPY